MEGEWGWGQDYTVMVPERQAFSDRLLGNGPPRTLKAALLQPREGNAPHMNNSCFLDAANMAERDVFVW